MRIGILRGLALRPLFDPDAPTGASPVVADTPAAEVIASDSPIVESDPVDPTPAPAADEEADDEDTDDTDADGSNPELTAEEWENEASKARKQAARYRTQRNTARTDLATAQARISELEAAASTPAATDPVAAAQAETSAANRRAQIAEAAHEQGVPAALLAASRELQQADSAEAIAAALGKIKSFLAPASAGGQRPPVDVSTAPTLDQQITDAEKRGDTRTSIALKAAKLTGQK